MTNLFKAFAFSLIGIAAAGTAVAQGSVGDSLRSVSSQLAQQGQISYAGTTHDSSNNQTWTNQFTVEASNVTVDEANCQINFHWHTTVDGSVASDMDTGIPFRTATEVSQISMAEDISQDNVTNGHGSWATSFSPQIWVVHIMHSDGHRHTVDFRDQYTAQTIANSMRQLISRCH